jgi:hypothetical protein
MNVIPFSGCHLKVEVELDDGNEGGWCCFLFEGISKVVSNRNVL